MNSIKKYAFSELYDMSSGISTTKEQAGFGSPFVSFSTVFNNIFLPDELPDLMNTSAQEQETYSIKKDDILITRTSETIDELAMSCVALKDYPSATYSGFTKRLRPKTKGITYSKYLAFYLRGYLFRKAVTNNAFMTLRASFNEDIFSFLNLYLPKYDEQVRIGDFLYSIEQKIALNKRINAELEAMAKTLYDYWFVQFDFPDENGKPYRTSGGAMEWNEQLKREIPKGWYVGKLKDIITIAGEPTSPGEHLKGMFYTPIDELPKKSMSFYGGLPYTDANSSLQLYDKNDLLLGAMRVYFHRVCIAAQNGITRSTTIVLRPKNEQHLPFAFETLNTDSTIQYATKVSVGTQQPYVNWDGALDSHLIVLPPDNQVIDSYSEIIYPIINIVQKNVRENYELTHLRDWLLPMLMNGQATVSDETNCDRVANFAEIPKTDDERFSLWLQNQGIAARGELDRKTLREIFNAMDDDDK